MTKIDVHSAAILFKVYEDQGRIGKVEDEVAKIILGRESRDPMKIHATLILIRDVYHAWAVDRVPGLLVQIDTAIKTISEFD